MPNTFKRTVLTKISRYRDKDQCEVVELSGDEDSMDSFLGCSSWKTYYTYHLYEAWNCPRKFGGRVLALFLFFFYSPNWSMCTLSSRVTLSTCPCKLDVLDSRER